MIIVTTGSAFDAGEGFSTVGGAMRADVGYVNDVRISRVDLDFSKVITTTPETRLGIHQSPCLTRVVRAVDTSTRRGCIDTRIQPLRIARRDSKTNSSETFRNLRQTCAKLTPRRATVGG